MNTIRIVAAVVDTRQLTMYKEDGNTVVIPQGDPRLRAVLEMAMPQLEANKGWDGATWADVDLREIQQGNSYAEFEAESNGVVRFFRVAKAKLKKILAIDEEPVAPTYVGVVPSSPSPTAPTAPATPVCVATAPATDDQEETFNPVVQVPETKVTQAMSVVDEIIAHAVPVSSTDFNEIGIVKQRPMAVNGSTSSDHPDESSEDTIVAVVDGKVIPNMELIKSQFGRAATMGSTQGVENFLKRLATVIEARSHSVEDLLKFMERADLPIADDGSIIIYKVLNRCGEQYVDCHSGNVTQWVGAYVCMDPSLVDRNRNNECSNGLHVARRGYIRQFSGDVCVVAKLAPEDVITVPAYDANKMRVCGYHILEELSAECYSLLKRNQPITSTEEGKRLLAAVMAGKHIRKMDEVRITGSMGAGVLVTPIAAGSQPEPILSPDAPEMVEALEETQEVVDTPLMPDQLEAHAEIVLTRKEQAQQLYDAYREQACTGTKESTAAILTQLVTFKKAAKVSWERLGIPDPTGTTTKPSPKVKAKQVQTVELNGEQDRSKLDLSDDPKPVPKVKPAPVKIVLPEASEGSAAQRIAKLLTIGLKTAGIAQRIYDIKKASKKSWATLYVSDKEAEKIMKIVNKE